MLEIVKKHRDDNYFVDILQGIDHHEIFQDPVMTQFFSKTA